ncbi:MAG TPA: hypothetical protein VKD71_06980 [Gemmataceae bacterium]|nr:hypothetical protein [Gemmataceae bacterium]
MDFDEVIVAVVTNFIGGVYWIWGIWTAFQTNRLVHPRVRRAVLVLCFVVCLGIALAALLTVADPRVRESPGYIVLFMGVELTALAVVTEVGLLIGLNALDDAVRRPNTAAVWATGGLWLGTSIAVAGANVGRGDTIGTTLGPLVLAVITILILWAVFSLATGGMRSVTLGRDEPSGIRLAALFVAWGIILGRAVAGDWESTDGMWNDFVNQGRPVVLFLAVAIVVERLVRPRVRRPTPPRWTGYGAAIVYIAVAVAWATWLGRPEGT